MSNYNENVYLRTTLTTGALPRTHTHTHTHTHPFNGPFPGLPRWAGTRKVKPIWILLKQETVSASGISWTICKSAPHSRQITMPAPHHSVFTGRIPFMPPNQQRQSTEGWKKAETTAMVTIARRPQVSHTASSYSMYSRRHVIRQRCQYLWSLAIADDLLRCNWSDSIRLIITWAVQHHATATLGMISGNAFHAVWLASEVSRYLFILCLWC